MKIGINASFARKPNTGIGQVTLNFLKNLSDFKFEILNNREGENNEFILYLEEDLPEEIKLSNNFTKKIFLPLYKRDDLIRKIWWEKYLLPKKVKEDKCDVFFSLYQCPTILNFKHEIQNSKFRHIMLVHDIVPKIFPEYLNNFRKKFYWRLTEKAIQKADKIITVSEHTKKDLIKYLNILAEKIDVNYIDVDEIYKKEISDQESQRVLDKYNLESGYVYFGGGLEKRKNVEVLLKAYKLLVKNNDQHKKLKIPPLVISGKLMPQLAPLWTDAENLIKKLNLKDRVKLLGFISQEDLPALYHNASMFIYPSFYEGFGLPVLEAMNSGAPVICSDKSSIPEVVCSPFFSKERNGAELLSSNNDCAAIFFDPKNPEDLAEKIKKLLRDENLRQQLSQKGKERAGDFSWDKFMERFFEIINFF